MASSGFETGVWAFTSKDDAEGPDVSGRGAGPRAKSPQSDTPEPGVPGSGQTRWLREGLAALHPARAGGELPRAGQEQRGEELLRDVARDEWGEPQRDHPVPAHEHGEPGQAAPEQA